MAPIARGHCLHGYGIPRLALLLGTSILPRRHGVKRIVFGGSRAVKLDAVRFFFGIGFEFVRSRKEGLDSVFFRVEFALVFAVHGSNGAENLGRDVGEDGSTTRGDAILAEQKKQAGQEFVNGLGGGEVGETGSEVGGVVRIDLVFREPGMTGAERGVVVWEWQTAALAIDVGVAAAEKATTVSELTHSGSILVLQSKVRIRGIPTPGASCMNVKTGEMRAKQLV